MARGTRSRSKNPGKRRQCEAEEHRQGQGLQHLGRERHCADDRQDEEGHDGRMVHRGLASSGHGVVPVRVTWTSRAGEEAHGLSPFES